MTDRPEAGRPGRIAPAVLASGLLLTSATQLRLPGTPFGPGEAILAGFLGFGLLATARRGGLRSGPGTGPWLAFWAIALAALATGWIVGMITGESTEAASRDGAAYLLCAALVALLMTQARGERLLVDTVTWLSAGAAVVIAGLLIVGFLSAGRVGPIQIWYGAIRFRAWSVNPNQLALLIAPLPWLALAVRQAGRWQRRVRTAVVVVLVALGLATRSDALLVAWAVAAVVLAAWMVVSRAAEPTRSLKRAAVARVIVPLVLGLGAIGAGPAAAAWVEGRVFTAFEEGGQGSDRVSRFGYGLEAVAASPAVGFGPGSFAGATGAFGRQEAHNTPIDWAASTGMVGLTAFALVCLWVGVRCIRARSRMATMGVLVLLLFMGLHYVLRQPIAWFYLLAAAALAEHANDRPSGSPTDRIQRHT